MKSCDVESFIILFLSLFLFGSSFTGTLWNFLVLAIVCASIGVVMYNFQGKIYMEQKLNTLAISNFKNAAKGSTAIIVFSWILVIINIFLFIYACASKDDFLRMLRKEQVDKNEANQFYTFVLVITVLSIIIMLLFLLLSYQSRSCFRKVNKELSSNSITSSSTMQ